MPFYKGIYKGTGKGWDKIVDPVIDYILSNNGTVIQVKQKFGTLRIYFDIDAKKWADADIEVSRAEQASSRICEDCGQPGKLRTDLHWIETLCDSCHATTLNLQRKDEETDLGKE